MAMKTKIFYILFLFFFIVIPLTGYGNNTNTKDYYQNLLDLARKEYLDRNYVKALEYLSEVNLFAKNNNRIDLQLKALNNLGIVYTDMLDYPKAIDCFSEGYTLAIKENEKVSEMKFLNNIGAVYQADNKVLKANEYTERAYKLALQQKDSIMIAFYEVNLALLANRMGNVE